MAKELQHSEQFRQTYNPQFRAARGLSNTLSRADSILMNRTTRVSVLTEDTYNDRQALVDDSSQLIGARHDVGRATASILLPDMTKGVSNDAVVTTLGYNYHAIGHRKFSPNPRAAFPSSNRIIDLSNVASKHVFGTSQYPINMNLTSSSINVYNTFECARIERLMIAAFPSTRPYFASSTYNKIGSVLDSPLSTAALDKANRLLAVYLYLALRPYLARPLRLRALSDYEQRTGYKIDDDAVMHALNGYLTLTFDRKKESASRWVRKHTAQTYDQLLHALPHGETMGLHLVNVFNIALSCTCDSSTINDNHDGQKDGGEDQQVLQRVAQRDQNDSDEGQDDQEGDGSGEGQGESQEDGDSQGDGKSNDQNGKGGTQAGNGKGDPKSNDQPGDLKDSIEEASKDASETAMSNESSRREVEDLRQNMNLSGTFSPKVKGSTHVPSADYQLMNKQMSREFGKIVEDADPGFITHQPAGRVSMSRAMHGVEDYDTAFDVWDEGKLSASSLEMVLLIDNSGSMHNNMYEACQSAWAIARGVESLGDSARVTKIFFNSESFLSKTAQEKEGAQYVFHSSTGGTDPTTALVDAARILGESSRVHRLCVILTDGAWNGSVVEGQRYDYLNQNRTTDAELVIQSMQKKGVQVSIANMFESETYERYRQTMNLSHGADIVKHIETPKDFVAFARSIVKEAMTK